MPQLELSLEDDQALDNYVAAVINGETPPDPDLDVCDLTERGLGQDPNGIQNPIDVFEATRKGYEAALRLTRSTDKDENLGYLWRWEEILKAAQKPNHI